MGAARDYLKQATAEAHRRLDENPLVAGLAAGTLPEEDYPRMLGAYLAFYESWELEMKSRFPDLVKLAGMDRFSKSAWLDQDLHALRSAPGLIAFSNPPPISGKASAIGTLYVVEGSTIGGMYLSRSGKLPTGAQRFFNGYGDATMSRWKEIVELLETLLRDTESREDAAVAAGMTFAWFQEAFDRLLQP
jgi:heme oxygenase